ncbi:unnamed protein product [Triticum turgidum subsp. durum]|uniref:Tf2-1-like SH3-like domain-containing protein n=1 Tax=Triticum turgidum subsp. durum TaxID=4567 RepID=A0A9R0ZBJ3_TRITD|nr:unnamed protein product [Triticum turgidum subsp. durum]
MKQQADKKRSVRTFSVGDHVYLKLQPYVQTSVVARACHKLAFQFFEPYKIINCINPVAYKLQLPERSQVHPVFHISQLRKALLLGTSASQDLPVHSTIPAVHAAIIDQRWRKRRGAMVEQVLIRWSNPTAVADSWEDRVALQARFPSAEAWGQASAQERGDVGAPGNGTPPVSSPAPPRLTRPRKPCPRVSGPKWV